MKHLVYVKILGRLNWKICGNGKEGKRRCFIKCWIFSSDYFELDEKLCLVKKPSFLIDFERLGRKKSVLYQEIDYASFENRLGDISNHRIGESEYSWRLYKLDLLRVWDQKVRWEFLSPKKKEEENARSE